MESPVADSARLVCSQGSAPSTLAVTPAGHRKRDGQPLATVMDFAPFSNIMPFGLCRSRQNPAVAEASAVEGALMPRPCRPAPSGPWSPGGSGPGHGAVPLLTGACTCRCAWAGVISIADPGLRG